MSDLVELSVRAAPPPGRRVEVECVAPDRFATMSETEIASLPVWQRRRSPRLGDFFDVRGGRAPRVRVTGDASRVDGLGAGMSAGELEIDGDAGRGLGQQMSGGTIRVRGSAGDGAGMAMSGGTLRIDGEAGDDVGGAPPGASRGMAGGEIVVRRAAGNRVGACARRGLVVVEGDAGDDAAHAMIAGSVIVFGNVGRGAAASSKRGTLVVLGEVDIPLTFRYACTFRPPHLRLIFEHLRRHHDMLIDDAHVNGVYRRYSGDMAELGRGEILQWVRS